MKKNVALVVSVGLNVVVAAGMVLMTMGVVSMPGASKAAPTATSTGEGKLVQALRAAGLGNDESKQIVESLVTQRETRPATYAYWEARHLRDARDEIEEMERNARIRASLLQMFGPEARTDPAFARSFRPYDREFPMFTSEQQIQLQESNLQRLKAQRDQGSSQAMMAVSRTSPPDALEQVLNPSDRLEYLLRQSVLAKALSATPLEFTEKEFRGVFTVLAKANPEIVMDATSISLNEALSREETKKALNEFLGPERLEALLRARDPSYNLLRRVAQSRGISSENIDKAYRLLLGAKPAKGDPASAKPPAELGALLGPQAAGEVYRAFTYSRQPPGASRSLSQASARLPGRPTHLSPISQ
jgi:hypothetical protein